MIAVTRSTNACVPATSDDTAATIGIYEMQNIAGPNRKDERCTWPGGLGAITRKLAETLQPGLAERMQTGATIVAVVPDKNEVHLRHRGQLDLPVYG